MNDFSNQKHDAFLRQRLKRRFSDLKAEIHVGLDQLDRGESYSAESVFADVRARIAEIEEAQ